MGESKHGIASLITWRNKDENKHGTVSFII